MTFPTGHQLTLINRVPVMTADPVTGEQVPAKDEYGDDIVDVAEVTVMGAFDPGGFSERADVADVRPAVLLPPGSPELTFTSAVRYAGVTYEVDGPPQTWDSPFTGTRFGVRVPLKAQLRRP